MANHWRSEILRRFGDREDIGKREVYQQYWSEMPEQAIMELFELIAIEYKLPAGLLRADDSLDKLLAPVRTRNPLKWLVYQLRAGDRQSELNRELTNRMKQDGTLGKWEKIDTIDDLVRAWCGRLPRKSDQNV